ncbi:MAG: 16S rRNA processing protein RimM [Clostridia bacterium]|nr:16S rRNA processing protein RimM [Clostridia bacterium]
MQDYLLIGEITKPQGVQGELKLRPITCDPYRFEGMDYAYLKDGENYKKVSISVRRVGADAIFFRMEGIQTRNDAETMRGQLLYIDRAHAVELDEDSTFICDLMGLKGVLSDGSEIGKIVDVMQPGGNDVYVFKGARGEVLVPALKSVVVKVDLAEGVMLLDSDRMAEVAVYDDED